MGCARRMLRTDQTLGKERIGRFRSGGQMPPSPSLSPRIARSRRFGGRGDKWAGTLTQGGVLGFPPRACPGLNSVAPSELPRGSSGLVPLHFLKNLQFHSRSQASKAYVGMLVLGDGQFGRQSLVTESPTHTNQVSVRWLAGSTSSFYPQCWPATKSDRELGTRSR